MNKDLARAQRDYTAARRAFRTASKYNSALDRDQAQVLASVQTDLARSIQCNGAMVRSILSLIDRIDQGKTAEAGKQDGQAYSDRPGLHGYIPIDLSRFFNMLVELGRHLRVDSDYRHSRLPYRPVSFLEVGCGSGRNLLLTRASALLHLSEMAGFDINADQIEIGRSVFGLQDELSVDDAMQVDYGSYDVVYSFRPFHDTKMQSEYEAHLVASMRCSAYLIAPIAEDLSLFPDLACISPDHHIWKKLSGSGTGG